MNYSIDLNKNIIYCDFTGDLTVDILIENIKAIRNDPKFHININTISDLRQADLSQDFLEMKKLSNFIIETSSERGNFKLALIVSHTSIGGAGLYKILSKENSVKMCFTMEEAEAWVSI